MNHSRHCYYSPPIRERSIVITVRVCVCVRACVSVCLFVCPRSYQLHVRFSPNSLCILPVAVARFSSGGVGICYVLPVYG